MKSRRTPEFRQLFARLPSSVQAQAREKYRFFKENPQHPSLHFKPIHHPTETIYSVRINKSYRALAFVEGDTYVWFWVGTHGDYDKET